MATIKGLGVVWGVDNCTFTGAIASATNAGLLQGLDLTRDATKVDVQDYQADTRAVVFHDFKKRATINVIPSGTSIALAAASLDAWIPQAGGTITVSATGAFIDGTHTGKYNILSSRGAMTNTGVAVATLEIEQFENNDVTTVIA